MTDRNGDVTLDGPPGECYLINSVLLSSRRFAEMTMPSVLIKNLPEPLHRKLKRRARAHRRSMTGELIEILESVLDERAGPPTLEELDRFRVAGARPLSDELLGEAIRTDRK